MLDNQLTAGLEHQKHGIGPDGSLCRMHVQNGIPRLCRLCELQWRGRRRVRAVGGSRGSGFRGWIPTKTSELMAQLLAWSSSFWDIRPSTRPGAIQYAVNAPILY